MSISNILQIGDIHYPLYKSLQHVDIKIDTAAALKSNISISPLATLMQHINTISRTNKIDFAAFVGDFTDAGKLDDFDDALAYFSTALKKLSIPAFGVPGNHDLQWSMILDPHFDKFLPFQKVATKYNDSIQLSFDPYRAYKCPTSANIPLLLYAFNSCLGCADIWQLDQLLEHNIDLPTHIKKFAKDDLYKRFDAPFIKQDAISSTCDEAISDRHIIPIFLAHHNIFPQKLPRIAIFPEMLNAGFVREQLSRIDRPVLYLHGHIHDDPIEILLSPVSEDQIGVISISAPLFSDGYNHLEMFVSDDGLPLGVRVNQYRYTGVTVKIKARRNIRFYTNDRRDLFEDDVAKEIMKDVSGDTISYQRALSIAGREKILEMEFTGLLKIHRSDEFHERTWRVSRQ